uniref:Enoyl-CoA delta isomerase 2 n=1 Tax=Oncorhynchus tshawytscha TaxID=74940 RepID=A0A8C8MKC9_ONCTS
MNENQRNRQLHTADSMMGATVEQFNCAKSQMGTLKKDPGNEAKLKIYALFKQATQGPCNTPKPGMLDFVGKAKWDAWKSLGSVSQEDARQQYVDLIDSLLAPEGPVVATQPTGSAATFDTLLVSTEDNVTTIRFNRPQKKNAINVEMYNEIIKALEESGKDDSVITVITGSGDFYCSGNDLTNFTKIPEGGMQQMAKDGATFCTLNFIHNFIDIFNKSLTLSKQLIRGTEKERLHTVNDQEVDRLVERWLSDECMQAIMSFFQAKAKL